MGPKSAVAALEELFLGAGASRDGRAREGITLVLIDEMDLLLTRKQKVCGWMCVHIYKTVGIASRMTERTRCWPLCVKSDEEWRVHSVMCASSLLWTCHMSRVISYKGQRVS